ncbi:MAG TPA: amidase family protein [Pseudomonadales bacterium]|nr:amidase family protein [Pseudomonadales bacterium]
MAHAIGPFSTATEMLMALRARKVSSAELVDMHLKRIDELDGPLNSIPVRTADRARDAAKLADAALARGQRAPLLGLPMTLKESTQTAGLPQTAGIELLKDYKPATDGPIAKAVFAAGACLLGKTNIPVALGDWQADSPIYGRTNNPWDLKRTPGGSTGGGSAALAAGLTPLEIGSDIGGSIRVPGTYCGVYGHRPTETAIPRPGSFPMADAPNPAALMGVQGPLARSAEDLELLFDVVAGPEVGEAAGWRLDLPQARRARLGEFRVAVMPPFPWVKPSAEMQGKVDALARFLSQQGAKVAQAMPQFDFEQYFRDYLCLLTVQITQGQSREEREAAAKARTGHGLLDAQADGLTIDAVGYLTLLRRREQARAAWRDFFRDWDVLIGPMTLDAAFEHQTGPWDERKLRIDNEQVPYGFNLTYPMWAIFAGQPSTAFPAGLNRAGLPLGLQAIGPYLEDRTTLRFAQLLEREWEGFRKPPGY